MIELLNLNRSHKGNALKIFIHYSNSAKILKCIITRGSLAKQSDSFWMAKTKHLKKQK